MALPSEAQPLRQRLRTALTAAMKARDSPAVAALRSALGALDNAEAADISHAPRGFGEGPIAAAVVGLGAGEVPRRQLTSSEIAGVVRAEVADRLSAAADYERLGRLEESTRLRAEAAVLETHLHTE